MVDVTETFSAYPLVELTRFTPQMNTSPVGAPFVVGRRVVVLYAG